jgi:CHAD domain-containing protein
MPKKQASPLNDGQFQALNSYCATQGDLFGAVVETMLTHDVTEEVRHELRVRFRRMRDAMDRLEKVML